MSTFSQFVGGRLQSQTFNSSGTFTAPAGINNVWISMIGGGAPGAYNPNQNPVSGGGSGAYVIKLPVAVTAGSAYTVTIGAGGGAGSNNTTGGTSSFGNLVSMIGGSPGQQSASNSWADGGGGGATGGAAIGNPGNYSMPTAAYSAGGSTGRAYAGGCGPWANQGSANSGSGGNGSGNGLYPGSGSSGKCIVEWIG